MGLCHRKMYSASLIERQRLGHRLVAALASHRDLLRGSGATVGVHGTNEQKIADTVQSINRWEVRIPLKQPLASKADSEALIAQAVEKLGGMIYWSTMLVRIGESRLSR